MIKSPAKPNDLGLTPDLTPLLDIIFIVMVFLLLTASVRLESLEVALPTTDSPVVNEVDKESITINLLATEPYWAIDGKPYLDWHNFSLALLETVQSSKRPIVIGADQGAEVQQLVKLLGFLQEHGIQATQLLTEPPHS
ncbi:biopolymer transporter ExbD [Vibrio mimicus]|uniref:TonB system transport protein ExbD1 n=1 Tax=Vibrio mimicus VM603 TaxID=671074 RepID=D2YJM5_VIBMI|nr:biopolymer transporter ExbD [Vibrio mimicus]AOW84978.1 biopolymer transporter ExbD [Vibrio mimicus]EEW05061.1 TonB system transport protein ExbD1 [Vibrio mimicus VM603]EEY36774.1 biopolymer transport protein ExbD1 [Vibrio mimicus MB451]TXY44556.1 biopolymer transporter ExbD [Vibrio mimicus]TXZ07997.1 biopolymer transporter ExbD [Vibrio mimicus]